jgi:ABC-2 type transport system permease protein
MKAGVSLRRLLALCKKESLQIVRDPSSIVIAFILPVVMLFIFGFGINLDSTQIRMGLVMEDTGEEAQRFAASFLGSPYMRVTTGSRAEMERALTDGRVRGFVVVAVDFTDRLARPGDAAPVQIITDGSEPNTANFVEAYARGAWQTWLAQRAAALGQEPPAQIEMESRFWFNPSAESRNYLIPGSITIIMTVIGALLTSLVVAREWERGTMEALLATPVNRTEILLSKLLPYYALGVLSLLICVGVSVWGLRVPFRGSLPVLLAVSTFFLLSVLGIGLLLSTATRNQFNAAQGALNAAFLPAVMLSGFTYEIASMPAWLRAFTFIIPARYFVSAMQTLFQAGDIPGVLLPDILCLLAASIFFIGLTALKTRRRLD